LASGTAPLIHGTAPFLSWASCAGHSIATCSLIRHFEVPRLVHGVCQAVTVIMSGQMIFRPAPHIPVNSLHRVQKPSRIAMASEVVKPQSGQVQPRVRRRKPRLGDVLAESRDIGRRPFAHRACPPLVKLR
jgi:hypothetical protein